jgi:endonuclease/exonuclease/phosphatase family metal-dependent hydrolase
MDVGMKFAVLLFLLSTATWAKWSVSTYNIRNFDRDPEAGPTDLVELGKIVKEFRSDVMAFSEVGNVAAFDALVKRNLPGYAYQVSTCGGFGRQHLAVVYRRASFDYVKHVEDLSLSGSTDRCGSLRPLFLVTLRHRASGQAYTFGALHLKAGGSPRAMAQRWQQYRQLTGVAEAHAAANLILLGDFNTTGYNIKDEDFAKFEEFLDRARLRTTSEELGCTSYWSGIAGGDEHQSSILDHIVVPAATAAAIEFVKVGAHCARLACAPAMPAELGRSYEAVSDHCPIQVTIR